METNYTKTGIRVIDEHHNKLLSVITSLSDIINKKNCKVELFEVFQKLVLYAENYFVEEEYLMQQNSYKNFSKHKIEHNKFIAKLINLQANLNNNKNSCVELHEFLVRWYEKHIVEYDNNTVEFLKSKIK